MPHNATKMAEFPALRAFMRGYLHEDYVDEYGTAEDAIREFRADADDDEFNQVVAEWKRFCKKAGSQSISAVKKAVEQLGAGWVPASQADLQSLTRAFEHPKMQRVEDDLEEE